MSLYLVGEIWYYDIKPHNRPRIRKSTFTSDRKAAQEKHDIVKAALWRQTELGESPGAYSWEDACKLWLVEPRDETARYRLKWLTQGLQGYSLESLSAATLEEILTGKQSSPGTYNAYVTLILAILNRARRKWGTPVPRLEKRKVTDKRIRWLSAQEWERLQKHLPKYLLQMARFTLATGLRQTNVLRLEWDQVDMKRKVAWIHPDQAKARKAIGVPLNSDAITVLREQEKQNSRWVFPLSPADSSNSTAGPTILPPVRASNRSWYDALQKAGLKGFRWHDLRHTWASWAIQSGVSLAELQRLGGWATPAMVMRYAHLSPEHLAKSAAKVKPVRRRA